jgi:hypothetical protein
MHDYHYEAMTYYYKELHHGYKLRIEKGVVEKRLWENRSDVYAELVNPDGVVSTISPSTVSHRRPLRIVPLTEHNSVLIFIFHDYASIAVDMDETELNKFEVTGLIPGKRVVVEALWIDVNEVKFRIVDVFDTNKMPADNISKQEYLVLVFNETEIKTSAYSFNSLDQVNEFVNSDENDGKEIRVVQVGKELSVKKQYCVS